jgi:hypothetical protein
MQQERFVARAVRQQRLEACDYVVADGDRYVQPVLSTPALERHWDHDPCALYENVGNRYLGHLTKPCAACRQNKDQVSEVGVDPEGGTHDLPNVGVTE